MGDAEFNDPRLVEVYDAECPWSGDDDYFVSLVRETSARRVLDLGCGTGRLALGLAALGYQVTGVDPAPASLAAARTKPGAGAITWVEGTSALLPPLSCDVAVMTSHVAQVFCSDAAWAQVLTDLHRALIPAGRLAFDARDPDDRGWERWHGRRTAVTVGARRVDITTEVTSVAPPLVGFTHLYVFSDGERLQSSSTLRFRTQAELRTSLAAAGFVVEDIFGGWLRQPVGAADGELLVVAHAG